MPDYLVKVLIPATYFDKSAPFTEKFIPAGAAPGSISRIVRAKNESAALKHVVADTIIISRATIDDAMRLANHGGKVEQAGE